MSDTTRTPFLARYTILDLIGEGGMGIVYRAQDEHLRREVALKELPAHHRHDPVCQERFQREARALAKLHHPLIPTLYDADTEGVRPYLAMEYISGESLQAELARRGQLTVEETIRLGLEVGRALSCVHANQIIHRDLKPANLLRGRGGRIVLIDFGLASMPQMPRISPALWGTPAYMSPELSKRQDIDHRSDLYSLGVVLFEALTGQTPYDREAAGESDHVAFLQAFVEAQTAKEGDETPPIKAKWLVGIIHRCLDPDPEKRPQNAPGLVADLQEIRLLTEMVSGRNTAMIPPKQAPAGVLGRMSAAMEPADEAAAGRRRKGVLWVAAVVVVLLFVAGWYVFWEARPMGPAADASSERMVLPVRPPEVEARPAPEAVTPGTVAPEVLPETPAIVEDTAPPARSERAEAKPDTRRQDDPPANPDGTTAEFPAITPPPVSPPSTPTPAPQTAPETKPLGGGMVTRDALEQARRRRPPAATDSLPDSSSTMGTVVTREVLQKARAGKNN